MLSRGVLLPVPLSWTQTAITDIISSASFNNFPVSASLSETGNVSTDSLSFSLHPLLLQQSPQSAMDYGGVRSREVWRSLHLLPLHCSHTTVFLCPCCDSTPEKILSPPLTLYFICTLVVYRCSTECTTVIGLVKPVT